MLTNRRSFLSAGLRAGAGFGAATVATAALAKERREAAHEPARAIADVDGRPPLLANPDLDQTAALQALIDEASEKGAVVHLPEGIVRVTGLRLRAGTCLIGVSRRSVLQFAGGAAFVTGEKADGLVLDGVVFDGADKLLDESSSDALVSIANSASLTIENCEFRSSARNGLSLNGASGRIANSTFADCLDAGLKSLDAGGLDILANTVTRCGNNGILIWREAQGEDGTIVAHNRVTHIRNAAGGPGEYGNGINVFRAGSVVVEGNRISDCAYTAIRGNAASNIQIVANSCERLGEVAIYAEFGFEGALIANNLVDTAATGISVTNFNEGGRLAVIQGNLIRNLFRREHEKEDKRGEGIGVEADASVTGNTIEGAPTVGIRIGWGPFMRDVAATGNVIRRARVGISVTDAPEAGACLIASNLISNTEDGAIRRMAHGLLSGPDLAREPKAAGRITLSGNVAV